MMKHIYARISAFPEKISAVLSGCSYVSEETDSEKMQAGSVYFDIAKGKKSHIYPVLRKAGVQIAVFLEKDFHERIAFPQNYTDEQVLEAIDAVGSAVSFASLIIAEDESSLSALENICTEGKISCPACRVLSESTLLSELCSISKEEGTVSSTEITQMAVLTARNDDIMRSLPYIEKFMPFIKELVVCCPPSNAEPFREEYKGRLKLSFITDDELLKGEKLPEDHQARNFFLRCRLMESEILKDVFIMTDDDYRPMKPLTEEVFLKEGRYRAYYFYDLEKWQGTYNNYTSFDKGAFRTKDFLRKEGYPTLQYSSHQPQIIDKRIFREMLRTHKGIENNPYDEWSTYFNYGFYHYPDKFLPCESVSMCWPGDLASWDIRHVPKEYLFENYYEELYGEGQIFEGFSKTLNENTETENFKKAEIYREKALKQLKDRKIFEDYQREYSEKTGEYPSAVIFFSERQNELALSLPSYIRLSADSWTRIPVAIDGAVYEKYADSDMFISYHYVNGMGVPVLNSPEIPIKKGDKRLMLPVRSPKEEIRCPSFMMKVILKSGGRQESLQKSIQLSLVTSDEVNYV
ncbi:MAG: hypothetical protein ACI4JD_08820 [Ruminococcus sp.]